MQHLTYLFLLTVTLTQPLTAQTDPKYNLDFEGAARAGELPPGWIKWGTYPLGADTLSYRGTFSGHILADDSKAKFGSIAYRIPANYRGKRVKLTGYMKLRDVSEGFAGLLLRIDGSSGPLQFDNMAKQGLRGTHDWREYSTELTYPAGAKHIVVGGILTGKGEAWFDAFTVTIDGEDIETKEEHAPISYPADEDHAFATGSEVTFPELTPEVITRLELLGRVWGFLKYHHPSIARGERQWDYDLFRVLPDYLGAGTQVKAERVLEQWIDALGPVAGCGDDCVTATPDAARSASREWMNAIEREELRSRLRHTYTNRIAAQDHYYIGVLRSSNPDFRNERSYADMPYPDAGFRLLALYRYWNMIRYFFPYVGETDRDWEEILAEYLPVFLNAKDELAYEYATLRLIGEVHDTHANLWGGGDKINAARGDRRAAVHLRFVGDEAVVTDFYNDELRDATPLTVGDIIYSVDGRPVSELVEEWTPLYPASNRAARLRDMANDLLRAATEQLTVGVKKATGVEERRVPLFPTDSLDRYFWYPPYAGPSHRLLTEDIGYLTLQNIRNEEVPAIMDSLADTKGMVIDIRNYPSDYTPYTIGTRLLPASAPFVRLSRPSVATPGEFVLSDPLMITGSAKPYTGKVVVLVNEYSQSQSEYTTMAFRAAPNTTVLGSTTAGADGDVSRIGLPGGLSTMISGLGVFYPDGTPTQRVGIIPDVVVPITVAGIREGRDELLERAVELIQGE